MKNTHLKLLALILLTLGVAACSKDKSNPPFTGAWYMDGVYHSNSINGVIQDADTELFAANEVLFNFRPDNTYIVNGFGPSQSTGTYELNGNNITMIIINATDSFANAGTWSISGRKLTLSFSHEETVTGSVYKSEETWSLSRMKDE